MKISDVVDASDRMMEVLDWHFAMPLVDHDGGDEDDELAEARQFLRAARQPNARIFRDGKRLFVIQVPELGPLLPVKFEVGPPR